MSNSNGGPCSETFGVSHRHLPLASGQLRLDASKYVFHEIGAVEATVHGSTSTHEFGIGPIAAVESRFVFEQAEAKATNLYAFRVFHGDIPLCIVTSPATPRMTSARPSGTGWRFTLSISLGKSASWSACNAAWLYASCAHGHQVYTVPRRKETQ